MIKDKTFNNYKSLVDLQLALIRIYIGLDFIHHFSEKFGLLGAHAYDNVSHYFVSIGFSSVMVLLAGLFEFTAFIGFTFGLFTRFISATTAIYLVVAIFLGHHYQAGFEWVDHVSHIMINGVPQTVYGGWEFPLFWAFLCFSFVLTGGRKWSLDAYLRKYDLLLLKLLIK